MKWNKINESRNPRFARRFTESASTDYKVDYVNIKVIAKYLKKRLAIQLHLENGKCNRVEVQQSTARYGTDPWLRWRPGKKFEFGGETYGYGDDTGTWKLMDDPEFRPWLEGIIHDVESKFA